MVTKVDNQNVFIVANVSQLTTESCKVFIVSEVADVLLMPSLMASKTPPVLASTSAALIKDNLSTFTKFWKVLAK